MTHQQSQIPRSPRLTPTNNYLFFASPIILPSYSTGGGILEIDAESRNKVQRL